MSPGASRSLDPHPGAAPGGAFRVEAEARRDGGALGFRFRVEGPVSGLRVAPAAGAPRQRHGLWKRTCFEAFVAAEPGGPYHELNFSPSGDWAHYAFRAYRDGAWVPGEAVAPGIAVAQEPSGLVLSARIALSGLAPELVAAPLHLGLSAVLEEQDGRISYWALHHPAEQADFHAASAFTLRLDPPIREGRTPA